MDERFIIDTMTTKLNILKKLKELLIATHGDNISEVILFGSQAKDTAKENSDYDILIILKNDYDWKYKEQVLDICYDVSIDYEIFFDIKIISINELHQTLRGQQPIFTNALKEGIYV